MLYPQQGGFKIPKKWGKVGRKGNLYPCGGSLNPIEKTSPNIGN